MVHTDYIIVGGGYATLFLAHRLIQNNKNFLLFSDGKAGASQVSAGVVNPVVLKKFTTFWKAQQQIDALHHSLQEIAGYTGENYLIREPVHRIFHDENEKKLWLTKSAQEELRPFLSRDFTNLGGVENPLGTGAVLQSARLDVAAFFSGMLAYLKHKDHLREAYFDYNKLDAREKIYASDIRYQKIVFAEGIGVAQNPFFSTLPVLPNKGHNLLLSLPDDFKLEKTVKKKHFLFPIAHGRYYYGGTYDRNDRSGAINPAAVAQLENGLAEIYPNSFGISEVRFGFRPTVADRRPILGRHPSFENMFVFNGLGARGVLNGCYFSQALFELAEYGTELPQEVDLRRFQKDV